MSNYSHVFPRAELKAEAKRLMRPNWVTILLVTLIYMIFMGIDGYTYSSYLPSTAVTTSSGELYYSASGASGIYATYMGENMDLGHMMLGALIAFISAILIQGVMSYCYTAFFIRMAEHKGEKMTFGTFVEGFSDAIKAVLAFMWQYLWTMIWGLTAVPGVVLLMFGSFAMFDSGVSDGVLTAMVLIGVGLLIAAAIITVMATLRYVFMYQIIADGRGKIGARQSMRYSIAMLKDHIGDVFFLALSFLPWLLLGAFTFGLAFFYVLPYMEATYALSYQWFRDEAFREGRLDPAVLGYVEQKSAPSATPQAPVEVVPEAPVTTKVEEADSAIAERDAIDVVPVAEDAMTDDADDTTKEERHE